MDRSLQRAPRIVALWAAVLLGQCASADDLPPAGRPWFGVCLSSLDRLHDNVDAALQAADQPELAEVLVQRLERWKNLAGVDRTRPLGLVRFWPHEPGASPEEVLFIPATDRARFMQTITFDVVAFSRRSEDHYVIARPGSPYHVQFRNGDTAWMGDRTQTLTTCSGLFGEWTSELVKRHDMGAFWDLRQIPEDLRRATADSWRSVLDPLLQKRDGEADELFALRRGWSVPLMTASSLAIEHTRRVVTHLSFDKARASAVLDVHLIAEPQSAWATLLQSWRAARSPWQSLADDPDVRSAGFIAGMPALRLPGSTAAPSPLGGQVAWQVFGDSILQRTAVLAVSDGPPAAPSNHLGLAREYQRVPVPGVPDGVRHWIGGFPEAWMVRDKGTIWLAFGAPEPARARLDAALAGPPAGKSTALSARPVCLSARIPLRECLDAIPWFDRVWMEQQLIGHEDRIEVTVTPTADGLQLRAVLPAGVLRIVGGIIGDDLAREADRLFAAPPE